MSISFKRLPQAMKQFGCGRSTFLILQKEGLVTRSVLLGARVRGWPEHELEAIAQARLAGQTKDQVRALVDRLHAQRQELGAAS